MHFKLLFYLLIFSSINAYSQRTYYGYQRKSQDTYEHSSNMTITVEGRDIEFSLAGELISYSMKLGDAIKKDYTQKIVKIGTLEIEYDYKGRIEQVGDMRIKYNYKGKISEFGNYEFLYDYQGNFEGTKEKQSYYRNWK